MWEMETTIGLWYTLSTRPTSTGWRSKRPNRGHIITRWREPLGDA
jgi:hypothetical protein